MVRLLSISRNARGKLVHCARVGSHLPPEDLQARLQGAGRADLRAKREYPAICKHKPRRLSAAQRAAAISA